MEITLKQKIHTILNNKYKFPKCVVSRAIQIHNIIVESNNAAISIRNSYRDIWVDYINKPKITSHLRKLSSKLKSTYGDIRISEFYKLKRKISDKNSIFEFEGKSLISELTLVNSQGIDLTNILRFVEDFNSIKSNKRFNSYSWILHIAPERFVEILLWKLCQQNEIHTKEHIT